MAASVFVDVYMGSRSQYEAEVAEFDRAKAYCAQHTPALLGSALEPQALDEGQRQMVSDCYIADPQWASQGAIRFDPPSDLCTGRVKILLYSDKCPKACENFQKLCTGEKGAGKIAKVLHYKGSPFHRLVKGSLLQAGDITRFDGSGGESIFGGKKFNDEKTGLAIKFDRPGLLAMANSGKNSNTSQFFLTLNELPQLNGKHVVFGEIVEGLEVIEKVDRTAAVADGSPSVPVWIGDCGTL